MIKIFKRIKIKYKKTIKKTLLIPKLFKKIKLKYKIIINKKILILIKIIKKI